MKVLHLMNDTGVPYYYVKMLRRMGVDAELLFPEHGLQSHPLWEIVDTDMGEIGGEKDASRGSPYRKEWLDEHRHRLPEWVHAIPYNGDGNPGHRLTSPLFTLKMIRELRNWDADLIHAWTIFGAVWASFSGKPYIYHVSGKWDWKRFDDVPIQKPLKKLSSKPLGQRAIKKADLVTATTPGTLEELTSEYEVPTRSLRHAVDDEFFSPNGEDQNVRDDYDGELLLFAGARHDWGQKRNNYIFKALDMTDNLPNFHLLTADWGHDVGKSKQLVSDLGIDDQVSFVPLMSRNRLAKIFNSVDAVLDQFKISFGSLAMQSLSCGTPVISAQADVWQDSNSKYWGIPRPPLLAAESPEEIVNQLERISDPETKENESKRARAWIVENYHWEDIMEDYISTYHEIVG